MKISMDKWILRVLIALSICVFIMLCLNIKFQRESAFTKAKLKARRNAHLRGTLSQVDNISLNSFFTELQAQYNKRNQENVINDLPESSYSRFNQLMHGKATIVSKST